MQVMCHGTHFPPDMTPSYDVICQMLGGQGLEIFTGDVKIIVGKYRRNGDIGPINKK